MNCQYSHAGFHKLGKWWKREKISRDNKRVEKAINERFSRCLTAHKTPFLSNSITGSSLPGERNTQTYWLTCWEKPWWLPTSKIKPATIEVLAWCGRAALIRGDRWLRSWKPAEKRRFSPSSPDPPAHQAGACGLVCWHKPQQTDPDHQPCASRPL